MAQQVKPHQNLKSSSLVWQKLQITNSEIVSSEEEYISDNDEEPE